MSHLIILLILPALLTNAKAAKPRPVGLWPLTPKYRGTNVMGTGDASLHGNILPVSGLNNAPNAALLLPGYQSNRGFINISPNLLTNLFGSGSLTFTMYLNSEDTDGGPIFQIYYPPTNNALMFRIDNGRFDALYLHNSVRDVYSPTGLVQRHKWHYLAAVVDNNAKWMGIYLDMNLVAETSYTGSSTQVLSKFQIGSYLHVSDGDGSVNHLRGRVFCAQLFNVSLNKSQIEQSRHTCHQILYGCRNTTNGSDYKGTLDVSSSGTACQAWETHKPHRHLFASESRKFPDRSVNEASSYCRNPDGKSKPWCHTTNSNVVWEYCNVPSCDHRFPKN